MHLATERAKELFTPMSGCSQGFISTMGLLMSRELRAQARKNTAINRMLMYERQSPVVVIKLLLLGAGECGKSTILKQVRIIHDQGFTEDEIQKRKRIVYSNLVDSMCALLNAMDRFNITLDQPRYEKSARHILSISDKNGDLEEQCTEKTFRYLASLWADSNVQNCYSRRSEFQLNDSAKYFFDSLERIRQPNYLPTTQDILYTRTPTTGIAQVEFTPQPNVIFRVLDVGGQKSERRKWIHYFDDVNSIIFIVAVSEFDQTLREDERTNRMIDSLNLWQETCNGVWFAHTSVILFLNKTDLFREKIARTSITATFPDYRGAQTYEESIEFIKHKFELLNTQSKEVHIHETCATNTNQVELVLHSVTDFIIQSNSERTGFA